MAQPTANKLIKYELNQGQMKGGTPVPGKDRDCSQALQVTGTKRPVKENTDQPRGGHLPISLNLISVAPLSISVSICVPQ